MASYVPLPAFRAPTGLDFAPLGDAFDTIGKTLERNRLMQQQRDIGASLIPTQPQAQPSTYSPQPTNRLMPATPAQGSAAAAGRDYPSAQSASPYAGAISSIESGGKYDEVGPATRTGDRAFGRYQVMGANVGPWTKEILGREMTPQEFLANPDAQEKVFAGKFGQYVQKTGSPQEAASLWFTGRPQAQGANRRDILGTTGSEYVRRFNAALGQPQAAQPAAPQPAAALQAPSSAPTLNYAAGIQTALKAGNVALAMQLQNAQQEEQATAYNRQRQSVQDQQAAETHGLTTETQRNALQQQFVSHVAAIAKTIQAEPDAAKKTQMWQRLINSDPRFAKTISAYGVDINDVDSGAKAIIAEAEGVSAGKYGTTLNYYTDPVSGKTNAFVMGSDGKPKAITAPGELLPNVKPVDTGLGTTFVGPGGIQMGAPISKNVAGKAAKEAEGKAQGEAVVDLPRVKSNSEAILAQIDSLANDPYITQMTGPIQGRLPNWSGDAQRVESKVGQLNGQAFLQAFASLKGGGQITEIEGAKATNALSRLQNMNVNDADYPAALTDFRHEVIRLRTLAEQKANGGVSPPQAAIVTPPPGQPIRVNSADEARQLIQSGKLKSGDHFTDETGQDRVVH